MNPDSRYVSGDDKTKPGTYGFPNKTNLKETIKMARQLSKNWEQLDAYDPVKTSQAMAEIRGRVKQEDMYLWDNINFHTNHKIYYFSYGEEDYQAAKELESSSHQKSQLNREQNLQQNKDIKNSDRTQEKPYYQNNSEKNILSFDNWIKKTVDVYGHLSEQHKQEEYQRYRNSFQIDDDKPYYN